MRKTIPSNVPLWPDHPDHHHQEKVHPEMEPLGMVEGERTVMEGLTLLMALETMEVMTHLHSVTLIVGKDDDLPTGR